MAMISLTSNFNVYGRWTALLSGVLLIALGIQSFISVFPFALAGFGMTFLIVILEVPFVTKWCPTGPRMQKFGEFFTNPIFRTLLYAGFSTVIWLSLLMTGSLLVIAAIGLSLTTIAYAVAMFKMDPPAGAIPEPNLTKLAVKAAVAQPQKTAQAAV